MLGKLAKLVFALVLVLAWAREGDASKARISRAVRRYEYQTPVNRENPPNCSRDHLYDTAFPGVTWDSRNWRLTSKVLDQGHYQARGSIANGYIGINSASTGPFFELDLPVNGDVVSGWPLFSRRQTYAGVSGFWNRQVRGNAKTNFAWIDQYGDESFIAGLPHWGGIVIELGDGTFLDATVDAAEISKYRSSYDYKAGILSWKYKWSPKNYQGTFDIQYEIFAHKLNINMAVVRMVVEASTDTYAAINNILDGYSAVRAYFVESGKEDGFLFSSVSPAGVSNVTGYVFASLQSDSEDFSPEGKVTTGSTYLHANESSVQERHNVFLEANKKMEMVKYVGIASTDAFPDPRGRAKDAATEAQKQGFKKLLRSHIAEWAEVMPDHSVDDFKLENGLLPRDPSIVDDAIMAVVNPYSLLQNTVGENAIAAADGAPINENSISVGGLGSDSYAGMIFWDAETWMQPGLVAAFPISAQRIANYRVVRYEQAKRNAQTEYSGSQNSTSISDNAAIFPWTSARDGNCTGTGPCFDYEYHINGDIGIALANQWVVSGDDQAFQERYMPVYDSIATGLADLLQPNGSYWTLTNMTDPDEYANHVDAGGYTMPLIAQTLHYANRFRERFGLAKNDKWTQMADNVLIVRKNNITLEYTTMDDSVVVKQADVILNTFPLDYRESYTTENALTDLDYYALKQSPNGPAMTWAIFSIVANALAPAGCSAHTYARYSYSPYIRAPFYQLSEQMNDNAAETDGTHPAFPFLTGHGGANQVVLFGYLGLRLVPDDKLHIDPNFPPEIPRVRYRTFYWRGWPISAVSTYEKTVLTRSTNVKELKSADRRFRDSAIVVSVGQLGSIGEFELPADGSPLTIANRKSGSIRAEAGNIAQCQPISSSSAFVRGQFPRSAVDGATSTKWQPVAAGDLSSVTVALPQDSGDKKITGCNINWAQAPASKFTVAFHDDPRADLNGGSSAVFSYDVQISDPWDPTTYDPSELHLPKGNSTSVQFPTAIPPTKFASLFIQGNQGGGGMGATVAEWSVLTG